MTTIQLSLIHIYDTVTIGIQEGQEYYCWYEDKNKSGLAYLPTELYEIVMEDVYKRQIYDKVWKKEEKTEEKEKTKKFYYYN